MLNIDRRLDEELLADIIAHGYSRIPVFDQGRHDFRGLLMVKSLILLDPGRGRTIRQLGLRTPLFVAPETSLLEVMNLFSGKSKTRERSDVKMALVVSDPDAMRECIWADAEIPSDVQICGVITLEDVIECIVNSEDERGEFSTTFNDESRTAMQTGLSDRSPSSGDLPLFDALLGMDDGDFGASQRLDSEPAPTPASLGSSATTPLLQVQ